MTSDRSLWGVIECSAQDYVWVDCLEIEEVDKLPEGKELLHKLVSEIGAKTLYVDGTGQFCILCDQERTDSVADQHAQLKAFDRLKVAREI